MSREPTAAWTLRAAGIAVIGLAAFALLPWWVILAVGVPLWFDAFAQLHGVLR